MHFRILKMTATSGFLTALECTKFVGRGPEASWRSLQRFTIPLSWFKVSLTSKGKRGEGKRSGGGEGKKEIERKGEGGGKKGEGMEGKKSRNTLCIKSCVCPWLPGEVVTDTSVKCQRVQE